MALTWLCCYQDGERTVGPSRRTTKYPLMILRIRYAMSGTDAASADTRRGAGGLGECQCGEGLRNKPLVSAYKLAMRCTVLTYCMVLPESDSDSGTDSTVPAYALAMR
eukprot:2153065-Rhodomonas_salina.1